jgi:hypothetical protein
MIVLLTFYIGANKMAEYDLAEHRFRFAAWLASRAAGTSPLCRFKVKTGFKLLEKCDVKNCFQTWEDLPESQEEFDEKHTEICCKIFNESKNIEECSEFTYGIVAKLINCYLKAIYQCGIQPVPESEIFKRMNFIHPPIDRILLENCLKAKPCHFKDLKKNKSWSKFEKEDYQKVIKLIQSYLIRYCENKPLWFIERYWDGHQ